MPMEHASWIIPAATAAKNAYANRNEIQSAWERIAARLWGKKSSIAFTGMAGVGKTVLFDHLSGKAYQKGYRPPGTSQIKEEGRVPMAHKRTLVCVVPGQNSIEARHQTMDEMFGAKPVHGVVHVVANGLPEIRNTVARQVLIEAGMISITELQKHQWEQELVDLDATCEEIRKSIRRHHKPKWLLVAVTKADLFADHLTSVEKYYSPHGASPFVSRLNQLQAQVGSDNFRWDAAPVCAWHTDFEWNEQSLPSQLKLDQIESLLTEFARHLEGFCE